MTEASVSNDAQRGATRKVGAALGIGIFILPWIFAWFLLRRGYSNTARLIAFGWMLTIVLFAIAGGGGSGQVATTNSNPLAGGDEPAVDAGEKLTSSQKNAARSAKQYLNMTGFSRDGLIQQLSTGAGDGYDVADATAAVDSLEVDWNENAVKSAKQYLSISGFSCRGLVQQLSSSAGDKYTESQAIFGARQAGACS
ncbi:Ltp family lipoprotein [Phenylobacterium sp.]|uniref:Ltp family lipoprotein n=1 Tax=Phenylobacterium sp. TaxID=1871053 RepID=UPI002737FE6D|nr:Ltp family lipoprotein [Phenylobacterium sp.]MDP3870431.1 Ltp family lipoprotein [Phenylobacterium sp.]